MSIYVRNNTATTIPRGRAVYSDGVAGGLPRVAPARANAVGTMPCIGITLEAIDPSQDGRIGTDETVTAMDTSTFSVGELLYVSPDTAGALTATLPASPNIVQRVGRVTFVDARDGRMSIQVETANFAKDGSFEIAGPTPELRLNETDQSAPAAEWRWRINSKSYDLEWAETAAYASFKTAAKITRVDATGDGTALLVLDRINTLALQVGESATNVGNLSFSFGSVVRLAANSGDVSFNALNSASATTTVAKLASANDPGGANFPSWQFVNRPLWVERGIYGMAIQDLDIYPNGNDGGAARRLVFTIKKTVGNQGVAQGVPNGANPLFETYASDNAPTTAVLDPSNITLRYTPAGAVTLYVNDAGVIKSVSLGTPV